MPKNEQKKAGNLAETSFQGNYITGEQISKMRDWEMKEVHEDHDCRKDTHGYCEICSLAKIETRIRRSRGARVL